MASCFLNLTGLPALESTHIKWVARAIDLKKFFQSPVEIKVIRTAQAACPETTPGENLRLAGSTAADFGKRDRDLNVAMNAAMAHAATIGSWK
jgi:hypothetical protein